MFAQDVITRIINVQWRIVDQQWLLGKLPVDDPGETFSYDWWNDYYQSESKDGGNWGEITSGASGLGYTVLTSGFVAFGRLAIEQEDGPPVSTPYFMWSTAAGAVSLGTLVDGVITWTLVDTLPDRVVALSYANDAFFVSYRADSDITALAVMRGGTTFMTGINPFPGVTVDSNKWGGNVAWNEETERYATVGSGYVTAGDESGFGFNSSFIWGSSSDGLSWSAGTTANAYTGIGAQYNATHHSSIAAGHGVFVAAAATKHQFEQPPFDDYVLHGAAVATSSNGSSWVAHALPGRTVSGSLEEGNTQGDGLSVVFVKTAADGGGYFMATGYETSNVEGRAPASLLWTSPDGFSWSLLRTENNMVYGALSAINSNLSDLTRIVTV